VQLLASIVATSQGTPVAAPLPPSPDAPLLEEPELEPLDPPDPPEDEPPAAASGPHPETTMIFSAGPEEHAAAAASTATPSTGTVLTEGAVTRRPGKQADHLSICSK
jgi:hypothetical protein